MDESPQVTAEPLLALTFSVHSNNHNALRLYAKRLVHVTSLQPHTSPGRQVLLVLLSDVRVRRLREVKSSRGHRSEVAKPDLHPPGFLRNTKFTF